MKNKLLAFYRKLPLFIRSSCKVMQRYIYCLSKGQGIYALKIFWKILNKQSKLVVDEYYLETENFCYGYSKKIEQLRSLTQGLHTILSQDNRFSYSVLISLDNPSHKLLKETLKSALRLTAPNLEILVGYKLSESKKVIEVLHEYQDEKIKKIVCEEGKIINILAEKAQGKFLFLLGQEDLVRCDILFRYEQILRMYNPDDTVLYCKEFQIYGNYSHSLMHQEVEQTLLMHFPYVFSHISQHSLLIPRNLWKMSGGVGEVTPGMEIFDLALKLDLVGSKFRYFPVSLYGYRKSKSHSPEGKELLQNYAKEKKLDWTYHSGYAPNSYRAIPALKETPNIHVIIPFKNQKELTLSAVKSLLCQKGVHLAITAIDNGSEDRSIGLDLEKLGVEVLFVKEPFNYSRLNNMALKETKCGSECDLVLFLNNDVELEEGAIQEMARWINQPSIGMVGCRLNYPNGLLQHGGVYKEVNLPSYKIAWDHTEKLKNFSQLKTSKMLGIVEGVTAACALMKKTVFHEVGGFDEIWYPICFSDTTLAEKLKARGYHCFYTPYALGTHHESVSRKMGNIEDVECSAWFFQNWMNSQGCLTRKK